MSRSAEYLRLLKIPVPILAAAFLLLAAGASKAEKPVVTLAVKRQVIDSDRDPHRRFGDSRQKTYTLRVEVSNTNQGGKAAASETAAQAPAGPTGVIQTSKRTGILPRR